MLPGALVELLHQGFGERLDLPVVVLLEFLKKLQVRLVPKPLMKGPAGRSRKEGLLVGIAGKGPGLAAQLLDQVSPVDPMLSGIGRVAVAHQFALTVKLDPVLIDPAIQAGADQRRAHGVGALLDPHQAARVHSALQQPRAFQRPERGNLQMGKFLLPGFASG